MVYDYDKRQIGCRIRRQRELLGLTQEQAAEKIGKSWIFYCRLELGQIGMSISTLFDICTAFNVRPDQILIEPEPESISNNRTQIIEAILSLPPERQETAIELLRVYLRDK